MKWFYMQAGAMTLLIAALAALYLRPVSYTHLDVYKRQLFLFFDEMIYKVIE